jgi:hypothetical protein
VSFGRPSSSVPYAQQERKGANAAHNINDPWPCPVNALLLKKKTKKTKTQDRQSHPGQTDSVMCVRHSLVCDLALYFDLPVEEQWTTSSPVLPSAICQDEAQHVYKDIKKGNEAAECCVVVFEPWGGGGGAIPDYLDKQRSSNSLDCCPSRVIQCLRQRVCLKGGRALHT